MSKIIFVIFITTIFFGCSSEGDVQFINRTDYNIYFSLEDNEYQLAGQSEQTVSVDIGTRIWPFSADYKSNIPLILEGETFMMQDSDGIFYKETTIVVQPEETLNIFCDPTHASVKLVNNSNGEITNFYYTMAGSAEFHFLESTEFIAIGDSIWRRLPSKRRYDFTVNGIFNCSDSLSVDEQLVIEWQ